MGPMVLKALAVWVLSGGGEILNGNLRVRYLNGKYGQKRAKNISFFTGLILIYTVSWLTLPWIRPLNLQDCIFIGLIWLILMLSLDVCFGRYVFRYTWAKILEDFDLRKGNLLGVGMVLLLLSPTIVYLLTGPGNGS